MILLASTQNMTVKIGTRNFNSNFSKKKFAINLSGCMDMIK